MKMFDLYKGTTMSEEDMRRFNKALGSSKNLEFPWRDKNYLVPWKPYNTVYPTSRRAVDMLYNPRHVPALITKVGWQRASPSQRFPASYWYAASSNMLWTFFDTGCPWALIVQHKNAEPQFYSRDMKLAKEDKDYE